jgi:Subtilisin inhibitor-like
MLIVLCGALILVPAALAGSQTALKITVWPNGKDGASHTRTLRCGPPSGTHPDPAAACRALARHPRALRPVPKDVGCTQQWDGPEVALVRAVLRGHRIRSWFKRTDGCEIGRWNALRPLFPLSD